jgi:hypothetical protein
MIKFFRNIRLRALLKGKMTDYFKYALGEIFLIVVGILIAFQINSWNEGRQQRSEEIETLRNIRSEFLNVIKECEENNGFRKRIVNATNAFYQMIHNKDYNHSLGKLDSLMADLRLNPTYNNQDLTLNILFNSGKINIIKNEKIKQALLSWPKEMDDTKEDEVYASDILYDDLSPILRKYISLYESNKLINFRQFALFNYTTKTSFKSDYEGLLKSLEFEGILANRELHISITSVQTIALINKAKEIIQLIDDELTSK